MFIRRSLLALALVMATLAAFGPRVAEAQTLGVVANGNGAGATIIDADTLTIVGTVNVPGMGATYDAYILSDESMGYVCSFSTANTLGAIDLTTSPPSVSTVGTNPLSLPVQCEDIAGTADDAYVVVSDGGANQPIVSIDTATFGQVGMISPDSNRNSVDVCADGSVLMTSTSGNARRLLIDATGNFMDTGEVLGLGTAPNNIKCSSDSSSGVAVLRDASSTLRSFVTQGMVSVSSQAVPGSGIGIDVVINNAGTIVYGRHGTSGLAAYDYDQATGTIGAEIWNAAIAGRPTYYGTDQMAITPDDAQLFVSTAGSVLALDALTGNQLGSISVADPRGIAFARATAGGVDDGPVIPVRPNDQLGKQVHLPILNFQGQDDVCRTWIEVQYIGCDPSKAVLVTWGEPGFCPPQAAGPLKVECTGLLQYGSTWNLLGAQIPTGSKSGILFKFTARRLSEVGLDDDLGFDDVVADLMCETLFFGVVGDSDDYRRFKKAYNESRDFAGIPQGIASGQGVLAVEVLRHCPGDVTPGVEVSSRYNGISGAHLGSYDPVFGAYGYYVPLIYAEKAGLNTVMYIQNGGLECSSVEIWFKAQDDCLRARICEIFTLAPGESYQWDASDCVGPDWQGSAWLRASQVLGIAVDIYGRDVLMTYIGEPQPWRYIFDDGTGELEVEYFDQGDDVLFGPLMYSEYQGWDTGVQVMNQSEIYNAKVKVYFLDRSGDVITTLVDWVCPRGSQTFFLPMVSDLPGGWVGSIRVESQDWWTPGTNALEAPGIVGVATLMKYTDVARTDTQEAIAYNMLPEHKAYIWQIGSGRGGTISGVGLIAIPSLLKDLDGTGTTSEIAIANLVAKPGFTDFAIYIYDQNGLLDFVCQKLHDRQVEYIDLQTWGYVNTGFKGSAIISATFWEHDVFTPTGRFVRNLLGLGAVSIERTGTRFGEDVPGDEAAGSRGIPFQRTSQLGVCLAGHTPRCPGQPSWDPEP